MGEYIITLYITMNTRSVQQARKNATDNCQSRFSGGHWIRTSGYLTISAV